MATAFHTQAPAISQAPYSDPAALIADMLDTLAGCVTQPQLRAWLSMTAEFRAGLPELLLLRVERERWRQERIAATHERQRVVAERVAMTRLARRGVGAAGGGTRSALLNQIEDACSRSGISVHTFGRRAIKDPNLVPDMLAGRALRSTTMDRIRACIDEMSGEMGS